MLTDAHGCSRMLTYALLTYADYSTRCAMDNRRIHFAEEWNETQVCSRVLPMLTYALVCSRMLLYAHVCSRMLTYFDVCWRMLTCAHVCSRMLTYADVCSRMERDTAPQDYGGLRGGPVVD